MSDWSGTQFVYNWKYFRPPSRPSLSELRFIKKKVIEKGKNAKVLILGATPEYREFCAKLKIPATLLDFNRLNYEYLRNEVSGEPEERFIEGNWISTALEEKFDIILGDNVINVLKKEDIDKLFSNVSKMLKKDGYFLPRTYVRDKDERYTGQKVINEYGKEGRDIDLLQQLTYRNLLLAVYDFKKESAILNNIWRLLKKLCQTGVVTKRELQEYENIVKGWNFHVFIPEKQRLNSILKKYFVTKEIFYGKEHYLKNKFPIHVLARLK